MNWEEEEEREMGGPFNKGTSLSLMNESHEKQEKKYTYKKHSYKYLHIETNRKRKGKA